MTIQSILEKQRQFFHSGQTLDLSFRKAQLKKLYAAVQKYQPQIHAALHEDLGKSEYEAFMCETGLVLSEITYKCKHMRKFAKKHRAPTPLAQFAAPRPRGTEQAGRPREHPTGPVPSRSIELRRATRHCPPARRTPAPDSAPPGKSPRRWPPSPRSRACATQSSWAPP